MVSASQQVPADLLLPSFLWFFRHLLQLSGLHALKIVQLRIMLAQSRVIRKMRFVRKLRLNSRRFSVEPGMRNAPPSVLRRTQNAKRVAQKLALRIFLSCEFLLFGVKGEPSQAQMIMAKDVQNAA